MISLKNLIREDLRKIFLGLDPEELESEHGLEDVKLLLQLHRHCLSGSVGMFENLLTKMIIKKGQRWIGKDSRITDRDLVRKCIMQQRGFCWYPWNVIETLFWPDDTDLPAFCFIFNFRTNTNIEIISRNANNCASRCTCIHV